MVKSVPTWSQLNGAVKSAIASGDLASAEPLLTSLWNETQLRDDQELLCNTHFTEGLLRDAQHRLQEAEAAFQAALSLDIQLHGRSHASVADTLHSLGIVRARRGDHPGAVAAYQQAVEVHRTTQKFHLTRTLNTLGRQLTESERLPDAVAAFEEAFAAAERLTPVHDVAGALLGLGEALRRSKRFTEAVSRFAMATQLSRPKMWPELTTRIARAWYNLGIVARYALRDCQVMAAVAFWYAGVIGAAEPELRERAAKELSELPERALAHGDPAAFRVVSVDPGGITHLASAQRGLFHFAGPVEAALGEVVAVTLDGFAVRKVSRIG